MIMKIDIVKSCNLKIVKYACITFFYYLNINIFFNSFEKEVKNLIYLIYNNHIQFFINNSSINIINKLIFFIKFIFIKKSILN
jgi:hypothetical protein